MSSTDASAGGMVLRSYQLRSLRVGQPGRATNLVSILRRMLPVDSRITEDAGGNMIHVLSSAAAHEAVLELVSAMDTESSSASQSGGAVIPEEVKKALDLLAETRPDAEQLRKILRETAEKNERHFDEALKTVERETNAQMHRTILVALAAMAGLVTLSGGVIFLLIQRSKKRRRAEEAKREASQLAVVPNPSFEAILAVSRDQQDRSRELQKLMESFSIAYQADRQRNSMLIETVSKRHTELSATLEQMQALRREIGESAGQMFLEVNRSAIDEIVQRASASLESRAVEVGLIAESASRKMDETASRLEVQNAKAAALTAELERTQREVDSLFDKLRVAQEDARSAQNEAIEQRRVASERAEDLARKEAALAGLSLLMQEPVESILQNVAEDEGTFLPVPIPDSEVVAPSDSELNEPPRGNVEAFPLATAHGEIPSCPNLPITFQITPAD